MLPTDYVGGSTSSSVPRLSTVDPTPPFMVRSYIPVVG